MAGVSQAQGERDTRHVLTEKASFTSDIVYSFPRRHLDLTKVILKQMLGCRYRRGELSVVRYIERVGDP